MGGSVGEALEVHALEVADPGVLPFATGTFDTIGPLATAAFPHRHSFYEIGLVTGGRGAHVVDLVPHDLAPPYLYALAPGQVHHWQDAEGLAGRVLLFTEDFLLLHPGDAAVVRSLTTRPLRPAPDEDAALRTLLAELDREYRGAAHGHVSILSSYLHILLLRLARLPGPSPAPAGPATPPATGSGRTAELADRFRDLTTRPNTRLRSVAEYARELGVSPSHLHTVVKRTTGRPPGRLIRDRQILEAKRLIAATGLTISQVSASVGFADPAYFCRFFRRETGLSPGAFRRALATGTPPPPGR
jgi:AraC-like DNA-binding protein